VFAAAPSWDDADEQRLAQLLAANVGGEGLDAFIRRISPRHLPPRHIQPLIKLWERTRRERVFACVELPPRHVKTTTGLHALAWLLRRDPALMHGFATFGDGYAASRSRIARALARAGGVALDKSMANLHEWGTVYGGGLLAHGYDGEWTGRGITGVGLIDDPFKNRATAESPKIRAKVWDWFGDVFWTRLQPGSSCIVQHTRWHDDDLIGRLLAGKFAGYRFDRIRLPAIAEDPDDLLGRAPGEALWPEQYPIEELRKIEESIGPYGWASLYQQRPRPRGADVFSEPAVFSLAAWRPDGHRILVCADPAATDDTIGDHSALFVLAAKGHGADMVVWILYGWRGRVSVPAFARRLLEVSRRFWGAPVVVESVGGFKAVPQMLRELEPGLRVMQARMGVPDDGTQAADRVSNAPADKFLRAQPAAAAWNTGRILVPMDAHLEWSPEHGRFLEPRGGPRRLRAGVAPGVTWADELKAEAAKFTGVGDAEDDQVDALSHGYNELWGIPRPAQRGPRANRNPFG
jgi:hypothetical protein